MLSHLAAAVAALPQASAQLAEILDQAKSDQVLETDSMSDTSDPTLTRPVCIWRRPARPPSSSTGCSTLRISRQRT